MWCSYPQSPLRALLSSVSQLHIAEPATTQLPQRVGRNLQTYQIAPKSPFTTTSEAHRKISALSKRMDKLKREAAQARQERTEEGLVAKRRRIDLIRNGEHWRVQKEALKEKFPEGWSPMKKLSPDAMAGIRALHAHLPEEYTTPKLADKFEVSPEAIRRILKAKWDISPEEEEKRQQRWFNRGVSVWSRWAEMGVKPPQKWRQVGVVRDKSFHEDRKAVIERRKEEEAREAQGEKLQRKMGGSIM